MGSFLIVLSFLAVGAAICLHQTWRSANSLRQRLVVELSQLKTELSGRHLIASHLVDSLPETFDQSFDRTKCVEIRGQAESALKAVDASSPASADINSSSDSEWEFCGQLEELVRRISADEKLSQAQAVAACLQGLDEANRRIRNSISTYNASAITFTGYLEHPLTSMVARWLPSGDFDLFDLNLLDGNDSRDRRQRG